MPNVGKLVTAVKGLRRSRAVLRRGLKGLQGSRYFRQAAIERVRGPREIGRRVESMLNRRYLAEAPGDM